MFSIVSLSLLSGILFTAFIILAIIGYMLLNWSREEEKIEMHNFSTPPPPSAESDDDWKITLV